ncbi:MAG: hypothetical protein CM15mP128_2300 [Methanobacteriota archaeon]|nr:MAG: hypothetical protein CM15mP128_2300 [Euryarchaeota archaeon]
MAREAPPSRPAKPASASEVQQRRPRAAGSPHANRPTASSQEQAVARNNDAGPKGKGSGVRGVTRCPGTLRRSGRQRGGPWPMGWLSGLGCAAPPTPQILLHARRLRIPLHPLKGFFDTLVWSQWLCVNHAPTRWRPRDSATLNPKRCVEGSTITARLVVVHKVVQVVPTAKLCLQHLASWRGMHHAGSARAWPAEGPLPFLRGSSVHAHGPKEDAGC